MCCAIPWVDRSTVGMPPSAPAHNPPPGLLTMTGTPRIVLGCHRCQYTRTHTPSPPHTPCPWHPCSPPLSGARQHTHPATAWLTAALFRAVGLPRNSSITNTALRGSRATSHRCRTSSTRSLAAAVTSFSVFLGGAQQQRHNQSRQQECQPTQPPSGRSVPVAIFASPPCTTLPPTQKDDHITTTHLRAAASCGWIHNLTIVHNTSPPDTPKRSPHRQQPTHLWGRIVPVAAFTTSHCADAPPHPPHTPKRSPHRKQPTHLRGAASLWPRWPCTRRSGRCTAPA